MAKTYVFSKQTSEVTIEQFSVLKQLKNDTFVSIALGAISPTTSPAFTATLISGTDPSAIEVQFSGGAEGTSYGVQVTITTDVRVLNATLAVTVQSATLSPYVTMNPEAYRGLVDEIEAGQSAIGTAVFSFSTIDPSGGYVLWRLLDLDGTVWSSGNCYDYNIRSDGMTNTVLAHAIVNVPSDIPPTLEGEKYQLQYKLYLPDGDEYMCAESIRVIGITSVPVGTQDSVEQQGDPAVLSIVTEQLWSNVAVEIYYDNALVAPAFSIDAPQRVSSGYLWGGIVDTSALPVQLEPYTVVFKYWNDTWKINRESAGLYLVNPSIMQAVEDVLHRIQKTHAQLYGQPDLVFPPNTVLVWLRRGRDYFNAAFGAFTEFTMTNAKGVVREYWLQCAEMLALESQELAEGEKAFDFQGANIQLNVDRTQYYQNAANNIRERINNELKPIKQNLIMKGNTAGDGSIGSTPNRLQHGAIGAVGLTITPASLWSVLPNGLPLVRRM